NVEDDRRALPAESRRRLPPCLGVPLVRAGRGRRERVAARRAGVPGLAGGGRGRERALPGRLAGPSVPRAAGVAPKRPEPRGAIPGARGGGAQAGRRREAPLRLL